MAPRVENPEGCQVSGRRGQGVSVRAASNHLITLCAAAALTLAPARAWSASFPIFEASVGQGDSFELSLGTNALDLQYDPTANSTGGAYGFGLTLLAYGGVTPTGFTCVAVECLSGIPPIKWSRYSTPSVFVSAGDIWGGEFSAQDLGTLTLEVTGEGGLLLVEGDFLGADFRERMMDPMYVAFFAEDVADPEPQPDPIVEPHPDPIPELHPDPILEPEPDPVPKPNVGANSDRGGGQIVLFTLLHGTLLSTTSATLGDYQLKSSPGQLGLATSAVANLNSAAVPEPSALALLAFGLAGLAALAIGRHRML